MITDGVLHNKEVRIENTNICNADCIVCNHSKMTRPEAIMPQDKFYDLVLQAMTLGAETISIFGYGEPLLDKNLVKKVQYCTDLGLDTFITTNASMLDIDTSTDLLSAGLKHIRFSSHGVYKNFEKVHRGLNFDRVQGNIFNFISINKVKNRGRCKVSVTVIPMNGEDIEDIKTYWKKSIDWLEIWKPHNWGGKESFRKLAGIEMKSCGRPFNGPVQIQADGNVIPCCFLTDAEIVLGNVFQDTIEAVLINERYEELREKHRTSVEGLPCEVCEQRFIPEQNPLLYSSRDPSCEIGKTSSTKFKITGE